MTEFEATGGCLCGEVRFQITARPLAAYYCHCTMCQKHGGGPFMAGATVPIEAFAFTKGEPKTYESSPGFVRLSCGECGSPLGFQAKDNPKFADFTLGCLDDPNIIKPESHQFTSTQVSWCQLHDDLPRYTEASDEVANLWT